MDCPSCGGEVEKYTEDIVTHNYCPKCQPNYRKPILGSLVVERTLVIAFLLTVLLTYPLWRPILCLVD